MAARLITAAQLVRMVPKLDNNLAQNLAPLLNEIMPKFDINTDNRVIEFLTQLIHESQGFKRMTENLNYTDDGLIVTFGYFKAHPDLARKLGRTANHVADQQKIANLVYDDANRDANHKLGNVQGGDGWRFRGGGYIQITGRGAYTSFAKHQMVDVETVARLIQTDPMWAITSAAWVFSVYKSLLDEADKGETETISKRINGGANGLEERIQIKNVVKQVINAK